MHAPSILLWTVAVSCLRMVQGALVKTPPGHAGSVGGLQCRRAEVPANRPQGSNRRSSDGWDPLYTLAVTRDEAQNDYTVSVQVSNSLLPFSDAFLSAETNGSCGVGEFRFDDQDFHNVVQSPALSCPLLLTTNRKSVMQRLPPLRWKPPLCGCVHFRAMVIEASRVYYAEPANKAGGPLAATLCSPIAGHPEKEMSVGERTELLCRVTGRHSGLSVVQRPRFFKNRRLQPRQLDTGSLDLALGNRHYDISQCCAKSGQQERTACLINVRRRRVDSLCAKGVPDIPFTVLRAAFMKQREESCCWRLAGARYSCFAEGAELRSGGRGVDFSLDETDPLNDLADFEEELVSLEKEYGTTLIARKPLTTTTPIPATTTTTTTTSSKPALPPALGPLRPPQQLSHLSPGVPRGGQGQQWSGQGWEGGLDRRAPAVSREIREQGGRSLDKTLAGLQRRMQKLRVKARCCGAGVAVAVAGAAYGDFNALWAQCQHSAAKHLASHPMARGNRMCSSHFHRCCMESAIRVPPAVVTLAPDTASSREWDRDRHLINTLYLPPHARPHKQPTPDMKVKARKASSAERRQRLQKASAPRPALSAVRSQLVDEPEIDWEPQNKREPQSKRGRSSQRRPLSRERGGGKSRRRQARQDEDLSALRRQRRLRRLNSRERRKLGSGRRSSRERADRLRSSRREFDLSEVSEEPEFQKPRKTPLNSGGRSKERRNRQLKRQNQPSAPVQSKENLEPKKSEKEQPQMPSAAARSSEERRKAAAERREQARRMEAAELRELFSEIADDVDNDDKDVDEDDVGSEESPDSLGLNVADLEDVEDDEDDEEDDDDDEVDDFDDGDDLVNEDDEDEIDDADPESDDKDRDFDPLTPAVTPEEEEDDDKAAEQEQNDEESKLHPSRSSSKEEKNPPRAVAEGRDRDNSEAQALKPDSSQKPSAGVAKLSESQEIRRRSRLMRLRSSEEDGHSGGRSGRRKRKRHHGRHRTRKPSLNHRRRLHSRLGRLALGEALEED